MAKRLFNPATGINWCIDILLADGTHRILVFDNYNEAQTSMNIVASAFCNKIPFEGKRVEGATLWEM